MGWLRISIGPAIVILLALNAGQAMALTTFKAASFAEERPSWLVLAQDRLLDVRPNPSQSGLSQNQRRLLENLLRLPTLSDDQRKLLQETLRRNQRLRAEVEQRLKRILDQQLADLERQRERERLEALESQREDERQRTAELERQRQEELERQQAAELERQRREEEERRRAAALERQRQEERERQRAAELERQRQEQERQRQEEEERRRLAALEQERRDEEERRKQEEPKTPPPEILTSQQRQLLADLIDLRAMSSVEKGMMRKILEDNRRLNATEEARLQQRYAALQTFEDLQASDDTNEDDVAVLDPPEDLPAKQGATESEPDEVDLLELLPRFKIEMPSPI